MPPLTFQFTAPMAPWSTNQDRNLHRMTRYDHIQKWKQATIKACARQNEVNMLAPSYIRIEIPFTQKRARDPHNYCGTVVKAIIDGMVNAGWWPNDTPDFVEHLEPRLVVRKDRAVTVRVIPREEMEWTMTQDMSTTGTTSNTPVFSVTSAEPTDPSSIPLPLTFPSGD